MAQLPKGGLERGHDKPIHGSCTIYFPGGISKNYQKLMFLFGMNPSQVPLRSARPVIWESLPRWDCGTRSHKITSLLVWISQPIQGLANFCPIQGSGFFLSHRYPCWKIPLFTPQVPMDTKEVAILEDVIFQSVTWLMVKFDWWFNYV